VLAIVAKIAKSASFQSLFATEMLNSYAQKQTKTVNFIKLVQNVIKRTILFLF
jgi:hypothetical protein